MRKHHYNISVTLIGSRRQMIVLHFRHYGMWLVGLMVRSSILIILGIMKSWLRLLAVSLAGNNFGLVVHTHVPMEPNSII